MSLLFASLLLYTYHIADLHNDFPHKLYFLGESKKHEASYENLTKGDVKLSVFSIWVKTSQREKYRKAIYMIKKFKKYAKKKGMIIVKNKKDLEEALTSNKIAAILMLEGLHIIEGKEYRIYNLYNMGIRIFGLTWSYGNEFFESADVRIKNYKNGISKRGKRLLKKLKNLGAILDLSHSSDRLFWYIIREPNTKIIATHSSIRELCHHRRNLTLKMAKALCRKGGIFGINFHSLYTNCSRHSTIYDVIKHIRFAVKHRLSNCIALGSDFDGYIKVPKYLENMAKMIRLKNILKKLYKEETVKKILWDNAVKYFQNNL